MAHHLQRNGSGFRPGHFRCGRFGFRRLGISLSASSSPVLCFGVSGFHLGFACNPHNETAYLNQSWPLRSKKWFKQAVSSVRGLRGAASAAGDQRVPKSLAVDGILFNIGLGLGYTRDVVYLPRGGLAAAGVKTEGDKHGF